MKKSKRIIALLLIAVMAAGMLVGCGRQAGKVSYVVEDVTTGDVGNYRYTLNFNPNMWIPVDVKHID